MPVISTPILPVAIDALKIKLDRLSTSEDPYVGMYFFGSTNTIVSITDASLSTGLTVSGSTGCSSTVQDAHHISAGLLTGEAEFTSTGQLPSLSDAEVQVCVSNGSYTPATVSVYGRCGGVWRLLGSANVDLFSSDPTTVQLSWHQCLLCGSFSRPSGSASTLPINTSNWRLDSFDQIVIARDGYSTSGAISEDGGATWTQFILPDAKFSSGEIAFNGEVFCILNNFGMTDVAVSTDGIAWLTYQTTHVLTGITAKGSKFVAANQWGNVETSTDGGVTWDANTMPFWDGNTNGMISDLQIYGSDLLVVGVANGGSAAIASNWTVSNNPYWNVSTGSGSFASVPKLAIGAGYYVIPHWTGSKYSTDLVTWSSGTFPVNSYGCESIAYGNGKWVSGHHSLDGYLRVITGNSFSGGVTPSTPFSISNSKICSICYASSIWVAVSTHGEIASSPDAVTWTLRASTGSSLNRVAMLNGVFVASGATIQTSPDGITWTQTYSGDEVGQVAFGGGVMAGVLTYPTYYPTISSPRIVMSSDNGATWATAQWPVITSTYALTNIACLSGTWVVSNVYGSLLTSTDLISWFCVDFPIVGSNAISLVADQSGSNIYALPYYGGDTAFAYSTSGDVHTWQVTPAAAAVSNVIPHPTNQELVVVGDDITFISVDTGIFETFKSSAAGVFTSYPCTGLPSPTANIRANILWNGTEFIGLFGFDTSSGYGSSCDNYIGRSADGIAWTDVTQLAGNTCLGAVTAVCGCFLSVSGDQAELICIAAAIATNPCGSFPAPKPKPAIPPDAMLPMSCHSIRVADLIQHLHRVFDQEPHSELLFRLTYNGGMTWKIVDGTLTTSVTGGTGANLAINLSGHTLATLIGSLSLQTGYSITFSNADYVDFSALILLDASGDIYASNGDHFYGYTSLLWSYFSALAIELDYASTEICEMLRQMSVRTAEDFWLDELGSYYKVPRLAAEPDVVYGPRIISETLRPKGNNGAIAAAIIEATGQAARVIDAATLAPVNTLYDGTFLHDASHIHDGIDPNSLYGLFDVEVQFDLLGSGDIAQFMADIIEQVERLRDAGTFLHQIKIGTCSALVENYSAPISDSATLQIMDAIYHNAAYSHNGIANYGGVMRPLEWLS